MRQVPGRESTSWACCTLCVLRKDSPQAGQEVAVNRAKETTRTRRERARRSPRKHATTSDTALCDAMCRCRLADCGEKGRSARPSPSLASPFIDSVFEPAAARPCQHGSPASKRRPAARPCRDAGKGRADIPCVRGASQRLLTDTEREGRALNSPVRACPGRCWASLQSTSSFSRASSVLQSCKTLSHAQLQRRRAGSRVCAWRRDHFSEKHLTFTSMVARHMQAKRIWEQCGGLGDKHAVSKQVWASR